jgi:hypothetical protein
MHNTTGATQSKVERVAENGGENLLDAGLRYVKRGWKIFPVNGHKKPLTPNGFKDATTDEGQIRAWAAAWPGAYWARAVDDGLLLIDLDVKNGSNGIKDFEQLHGCSPDDFVAPRVRTGTGGLQIYTDPTGRDFQNTVKKIANGIDTRAANVGYCVLPSGDGWYRWECGPDTPLPPTPTWAEASLRQSSEPIGYGANAQPYRCISLYGHVVLNEARRAIEEAPNGEQELTLNHRSLIVGHYVAGGLLEYDATIDALIASGMKMANYKEKEPWVYKNVRKKVVHAIQDGMQDPQDGEEISRAVAEANRRWAEDPELDAVMKELLTEGAREEQPQGQPEPEPKKQSAKIPVVLDAGDDFEKPTPRAWLYGNIFARKFLSTLFGDGGVGKTALRYAQYMSMAVGKSLTGDHVFVRCRVLIVSLEDDLDELRRRIWALRIHYGIKQEELKGWLYLWAPGASGGKLMVLDRHGNPILGDLSFNLKALITHYNIDFVGIDPFVKSHGVGENNNTGIDMVIQVLVDLCHRLNIGADIPHHVSKAPKNGGGSEPGDADRGRGASAMKDAARLVYTLNVMTKDEAEKFGIKEEERWAYIRMDKGKVNIVPPSRQARWYRLVGIPIGNEDDTYTHGDVIQVVEQWFPPDVMGGMSNAQMDEILAKIDKGLADGSRYTDSSSAKKRAAWKVVVDVVPGATEKQAREIIKTWIRNKVLVSKEYQNPESYKEEEGLWRG